jgi:hypothetical protein
MPSSRRARLTVLLAVLVVAAVVPAVVLAAQPKTGVYIDTKIQTYVDVRGNPPHVKTFNGQCYFTPQGTEEPVQSGGYALTKHLNISSKRKFSYSGKIKLTTNVGTSRVPVKIKGRFKSGKATGTVTFPKGNCDKSTFDAKYYGKNPMG